MMMSTRAATAVAIWARLADIHWRLSVYDPQSDMNRINRSFPDPVAVGADIVTVVGYENGGAVGNLVDRIIAGKVSDFIVWHYHGHEWPAFNVADAALVVGVCLMALDMILDKRRTAAGAPPERAGGGRR